MPEARQRRVTLEPGEWYVLCNWLRDRENRLMYALRPRSAAWERVRAVRAEIDRQRDPDAARQRVTLAVDQWAWVCRFLRRRALVLLAKPWRERERRDVTHLRAHIWAQVDEDADAAVASEERTGKTSPRDR